jgi:hypothetical protein
MATDRFLPRQFTFRGDRLAFSNGIIVLGLASAGLLVLFQADTHALIPLYAFGVFVGFTLSQSGMVRHWLEDDKPGRTLRILMNGGGAIATGVVACVILATKFVDGAWITVSAIAVLTLGFAFIHRYYRRFEEQVDISNVKDGSKPAEGPRPVIVPVGEVNTASLRALEYATTLSPQVVAVHVSPDRDDAEQFDRRWNASQDMPPLTIIESSGSFLAPILVYLERVRESNPNRDLVVVLPQLVPEHAWEGLLHNRTSVRLKNVLRRRDGTIVAEVPYVLASTN